MSKHTPGPWIAATDRGKTPKGHQRPPRIWFNGYGGENGHPNGGTHIADLNPVSVFFAREQTLADAHLIAAAPELLELAFQYISDLRHPISEDSRQRRIERAQAVIAKAEGRA